MGDTATVVAAPQHLRALEQANKVRLARADLKRRIALQQTSVVDIVVECPWQAESMSISDLLMSQRRWGRARCRRLLISLGIPENKQIGTFTDRQKSALVAGLLSRCSEEVSLPSRSFEREPAFEMQAVAS
ncbi:MAG TPA: hypothetical protein VH256_06550 [Thermoleophilaceae bacterium]|jgi:hypothetical protein|nr:hypothetical protein [Thermoleophilaceae bacterium]